MRKRFGQIAVAAVTVLSTAFMPTLSARADSTPAITEYSINQQNPNPSSITAGPDGALWFLAPNYNQIDRITTNGNITNQYQLPAGPNSSDGFEGLQELTAGPDGNLWYTAAGSNAIGRMSLSGSVTLFQIPTKDASPDGIIAGSDGAMWFTEAGSNKIGRVTTSGDFTEFSVPTDGSIPIAITAGPDDAIWFTEANNGGGSKIGRITTSGSITEYAIPSNDAPNAITTGPDGALWFSEVGLNDYVGRISTDGVVHEYSLGSFDPGDGPGPSGVVQGQDGALWFAEENSGSIGRITTRGDVANYSLPTQGDTAPRHIAAGSDGALWFTESNAAKIGRITVPVNTPTLVQAINAGGDGSGNFVADTDFSGGQSYTSTAAVDTSNVTNPAPQDVYQSARYGSAMTYTLPGLTPNADYTLRLHFNEMFWGANGNGGIGSRVFNVSVNGTPALTNFDIFKEAGGANRAVVEQLPATADSDGNVTIQFSAVTDNAMVNGIELYAGTLPDQPTPPTVTSARIAAGGAAAGDFVADTDFNGGSTYSSIAPVDTSNVDNPAPESVYRACRYGNFSYLVSHLTPNSSFTVRLHFNELYWGTPLAGFSGGAGSRVFNVSINGSQVLTNFDIFHEAGGANIGIVKDFTAQTDSSGQIYIQFASVSDNATVNGIEIVPSS